MKYIQLLTLLFISMYSYAQPGTLDNNFDANGIVTLDFFGDTDYAYDMHIQPDGKIVVCGTTRNGSSSGDDLYVVRINPDGSLDNTFGSNGLAHVSRTGVQKANALAIQADGKVVVGGRTVASGGSGEDFYIVRFNTDGSLDPNFGTAGQVVHQVGLSNDEITDIAILPDGKIIAIGRSSGFEGVDIALVRFNPDGSIDNSFSFDGQVVTDVAGDDEIGDFYLQDNGKITAIGYVSDGSDEVLVIRYNADGVLDDSFGSNGVVLLDVMTTLQYPKAIAVTPAGEIIIVIAAGSWSNPDILLVRLLSDGTLDNSFSFDGIVQADFGLNETPSDMLIQPDGKILVVGLSEDVGFDNEMALFRYNADGIIDNSFGTNGRVITPVGGSDRFTSVSLQEDGKIVASGNCSSLFDSSVRDVCIARYLSGINIGIGEVDAYIGSTLIYPNPITDNSITVEYELKSDETVSIELYDLSGKQVSVLQTARDEKANSYQKTLSLPTLSAGNYLLKLNTDKGAVSVKLMVN